MKKMIGKSYLCRETEATKKMTGKDLPVRENRGDGVQQWRPLVGNDKEKTKKNRFHIW